MKKFLRSLTAAALSAALLISAVSAATLGTYLRQDTLELSDTATMVHSQMTGSSAGGGQQTENIIEYRAEEALRPIVAYGTTLYGRSDANYVASYLRTQGLTPVAAVNAGFFTMATGVPMGLVLTDGVIRSSGNGQSVGFRDDGTAIIGQPGLDISVTYPNGDKGSVLYNKTLTLGNGIILYSQDFDTKTKNTISAYNVVLRPDTAQIVPGQAVTAQVVSILPETASCDIPAGCFVLSMATDTEYTYTFGRQIGALKAGDTVSISCTVSEEWADVTYGVGADELLVVNGVAKTEFNLDSANRRAARTAAGLKSDGTLILYTVDGGQTGYSGGLTLPELAKRMEELGCVTAVNLDGGGSTTFVAQYPGDGTLTTVNRPSDGSLRKCANFIFLARETTTAGEAEHLHLYPYDGAVLSGGQLNLTVKATDGQYNATTVPSSITYSATGGTVSADGVFTAGNTAGTAVVQAEAANGASGSRNIRVVTNPSSVSVRNEASGQTVTSLTVAAGSSVNLTAVAAYNGYNLTSQDTCFTWTAPQNIGTIDQNGVFTAAATTSGVSGVITCSVGGVQASVSVTVTPLAPEGGVIHGFEQGQSTAVSGTGLTAAANTDLNFVRYGKGSLRATYDLTRSEAAADSKRQVMAGLNAELPSDADHVGLWIYGDGSGNSFSLRFTVGDTVTSQWLTQLNFSGWRYFTTTIPTGATAVAGFAITEYETASAVTGTIYLDQLAATSGKLEDTTPPSLTVNRSGDVLNITVADTGSGVDSLTVSLDGEAQPVTLADGKAAYALPTDGQAHQVRVTAADQFGNLTSKTVEVSGTLSNPFADLDNHWSRTYVDYCYREGILNGSADADGTLRYRPDDSMTRQEFAAAMVRFLGIDTAAYSAVELPFADTSKISAWALDSMKAAYSLGLITGSASNGQLYANPTATITRQEAMTILGRTQEKGYAEDALTGFTDSAQVASWSRSYIAAMVSRGVITGSNGKLNPTGTVTRGQVAKMLYSLY